MKTMKKLFKFLCFPLAIMVGTLGFASYMAWKEHTVNNNLINRALQGNQIAIAILGKYEKPWKIDKKIIDEALKDNKYALQILGVEIPAKS